MKDAGLEDGPHRCPKGLRHGYGVHAISHGVPLNMLRKWMGHASMEIMAIYANALGAEDVGVTNHFLPFFFIPEKCSRQDIRVKSNGAISYIIQIK